MMYEIDWSDAAIDMLATIWMYAADREDIVLAAAAVDDLLETDPLDQGESRGESHRILIQAPLTIYYVVFEAERSVLVTACRLIRKRKP